MILWKRLCLGVLLAFTSVGYSSHIHLVGSNRGQQYDKDIAILTETLKQLGHSVEFFDINGRIPSSKVDINVFLDEVNASFVPLAHQNYLIPNPEKCSLTPEMVASFDRILCKTREAKRIFAALNPNVEYISFTSKDCYDPLQGKKRKAAFHVADFDSQEKRGSDCIARLWIDNPQFPSLFFFSGKNTPYYPSTRNLVIDAEGAFSPAEFNILQNCAAIHICTTESVGFSHPLVEAMSCGNVVVTTNAPPMNEWVTDPLCLVNFRSATPSCWGTLYAFNPTKLDLILSHLLIMPEEDLIEMGRKNREWYLENDRFFKQRLAEVFNAPSQPQPKTSLIEHAFTYLHQEQGKSQTTTPKLYRAFLQDFLKQHGIKSVVDVGCGAWQVGEQLDWAGVHYTGIDLVKEVIDKNRIIFGGPSLQFIQANALEIDLPEAELIICKDVFQYLPNQEIQKLLQKFKKYKHCLIVNDVDPSTLTSVNADSKLGGYHLLDLTQAPFYFQGTKELTFKTEEATKQVLWFQQR